MTVRDVVAADLCIGCGLCVSMYPSKLVMHETPGGYLQPRSSSPLDPEEVRAHLDFFAERMLHRVDATEEQTARIKEILNASADELLVIGDAAGFIKVS